MHAEPDAPISTVRAYILLQLRLPVLFLLFTANLVITSVMVIITISTLQITIQPAVTNQGFTTVGAASCTYKRRRSQWSRVSSTVAARP